MNRRFFLLAGVLAAVISRAPAQLTGFGGELRYQHRYQDVLSGGMLAASRQASPMLALGLTGHVVSPRLAVFSLNTNVSTSFSTAGSGVTGFNASQYSWEYYDLSVGLLQYSLVKFDAGAREGILETTTELDTDGPQISRSRRRELRLSAATYKIRFLPSMNVSHTRTRAWTLTGEPSDQRSELTSVALSAVNGSTSLALSGSLTDIRERSENMRERYLTVQMDAGKEIDERNRLDLSSAYNSFSGFRSFSGSASYTGAPDPRISLGTTLSGTTYAGAVSATRVLSAGQSVRFTQDEHMQYIGTALVRTRRDERDTDRGRLRVEELDWNTGLDVQHVRSLGILNISNGLSGFYGRQQGIDVRRSWGGRFRTGLHASTGDVRSSLSYGLGGDVLENSIERRHVSQEADLRVTADLHPRLTSTTQAEFRDERYAGDVQSFRNRRFLHVRQSLRGSTHLLVPLAASAGAGVTWYYLGVVGRTYGWNFSVTSGSFFVRGLYASYLYSRTFDPFYRKEVLEQSAEFRLQWRRLSFDLRLRQHDFFSRIRDVSFTVSRPL